MPENSSPNITPAPLPATTPTMETTSTNSIEIIIDAEGNVVLSDLPEALLPLLKHLGHPNPLATAPVCTLYPQSPESPDPQD